MHKTAEMTREELKTRILDYLKSDGGSQYENLRQFGLEQSINRPLTHDEDEMILEILHEFHTANILMPAYNRSNTGWPWFGLTAHGRQVLAAAGPPVYDYDGYLRDLRARATIDPIVEVFLSEALQAYQRSLFLAAVAMLGCASERAIWLLMNAYVDAIAEESNREKLRTRIASRDISYAYKRFRESFDSTRNQLSPALSADFDVHVDAVFQFARLLRNSVVHPSTLPSISHAVAYASLQQFSYYLPSLSKIIEHVSNHPITV
jgi:hypothetical protein